MQNLNSGGYQFVRPNDDASFQERRAILGLTQKQVAEKAKIPLQSYQRFESGTRNIRIASFQIACRVIEALEMNISDYFHGQDFRDE
jgi:transcriptional regulator with XRE-family HTH domain